MDTYRIQQNDECIMRGDYTSATVVSTATNYIMDKGNVFTHTFRSYIQLRENGSLNLKFWHSNAIDSTWDMGQVAVGSQLGGEWLIEAAFVADGGKTPDGKVVEGSQIPVTFAGKDSKKVTPGEKFYSDEVSIHLPEGHYLSFTWTITTCSPGKTYPFNVEQMLVTAYDAPGNLAHQESATSFTESENMLVFPSYIGYKKDVGEHIVFLGDSITQGVRTTKDAYEYWVARIAAEMGSNVGVWNIGSGWGRAYDTATDGSWLYKAKQGNKVIIALGVNDIDIGKRSAEQLLTDLTTIVSKIKETSPSTEVTLFTVPTFNFSGEQENVWRKVNHTILTHPPVGVSRVFDVAHVLSQAAPNDHLLKPEYMSSVYDPHPNGLAGKAISDAFMSWYRRHYGDSVLV
ncbi:SGNH/GDSL hydrolase family protein [Paenibacillus anaericanus]|nr:SGNH/GDSL hydrolase family protein [Paenibacillus anaericanus]